MGGWVGLCLCLFVCLFVCLLACLVGWLVGWLLLLLAIVCLLLLVGRSVGSGLLLDWFVFPHVQVDGATAAACACAGPGAFPAL